MKKIGRVLLYAKQTGHIRDKIPQARAILYTLCNRFQIATAISAAMMGFNRPE